MTTTRKHVVYVSATCISAWSIISSLSLPPLALVTLCISFPTDTWTAQATTGEKPPALYGHTLTMVDQHRSLLFGGYGGGYHNDTYILDMETWVRVSLCILHFVLYLCHVHGRRVGESPL